MHIYVYILHIYIYICFLKFITCKAFSSFVWCLFFVCDILAYPHGGYTSNWSIWNPFFGLLVYIVWERDEDRHLFDQEVESAKFLICMQRCIFYDCMDHRGVLFPPNKHHEWSTFNFSNRFPAQLRSSRVNNTRTWLQIFGFNMIQHHPLFSLLHDS